jgi:hypothetical protein
MRNQRPVIPAEILSYFEDEIGRGTSSSLEAAEAAGHLGFGRKRRWRTKLILDLPCDPASSPRVECPEGCVTGIAELGMTR